MGKYMRKSKSPVDVAVKKDVSRSSVGVCTRAKTLASRRLRSSAAYTASKSDLGYLELRSRRLVKRPPLMRKCMRNSREVALENNGFTSGENEGNESAIVSRKACSGSGLKSGALGPGKGENAWGLETGDLEIEVSFGENNLESENRGRDSTPCSLIMVAETSTIPGSAMKQTSLDPAASQRAQNAHFIDMPTADEVEEFFAREEQFWQRLFTEKYNFDFVNDLPLPGRYDWVKVSLAV